MWPRAVPGAPAASRVGGGSSVPATAVPDTRSRRGRLALRVLFSVVVLIFVAQLVVTDGRREPYPALFQPSFGDGSVSADGTTMRPQATVVARFADGTTARYDHNDVMAESMTSPWRVMRSAFGPTSPRRDRPETVAWMHDRVAALSGRQPVSVVVEWHDVFYDLRGQAPPVRVLTERTPFDLGSTGG